jgi:hypothetical protein
MMKGVEVKIVLTVRIGTDSMKEVTCMKSLSFKFGVVVFVMGLTICHGEVWAAEWKEFAEATTGVFDYDAANISSPSEGFVRVWIHNVTKHETNLVELNCKDKRYHVLDVIQYDEAGRMKSRDTYYDNPTHSWLDISPESVPELLYVILCP